MPSTTVVRVHTTLPERGMVGTNAPSRTSLAMWWSAQNLDQRSSEWAGLVSSTIYLQKAKLDDDLRTNGLQSQCVADDNS